MDKEEYLNQLSMYLNNLPESERMDALDYYREYIEDAKLENFEQIVEKLGTAESLSEKILRDYSGKNEDEKNTSSFLKKIVLVFAFIGAFPFIVIAFSIILGFILFMLASVLMLFALLLFIMIIGFMGLYVGFNVLFLDFSMAIFYLGIGITCMSIFFISVKLGYVLFKLCIYAFLRLFKYVKERRGKSEQVV